MQEGGRGVRGRGRDRRKRRVEKCEGEEKMKGRKDKGVLDYAYIHTGLQTQHRSTVYTHRVGNHNI